MKLPFLASFIIFLFWLTYELHKHKNDQAKVDKAFWDKEKLAEKSFARDLDTLDYIQIPQDLFPYEFFPHNERLLEDQKTLESLSKLRIMNFSGKTNTELKLQFGAANIDALTEYDHNFTLLCRLIYNLSKALVDTGYENEALLLLEYAISIQVDVSGCYYLLADLYQKQGELKKIETLIEQALKLNNLLSKSIVRNLRKSHPTDDSLHSS
jgi:tetratricopeptide (TPR) repeat protein